MISDIILLRVYILKFTLDCLCMFDRYYTNTPARYTYNAPRLHSGRYVRYLRGLGVFSIPNE